MNKVNKSSTLLYKVRHGLRELFEVIIVSKCPSCGALVRRRGVLCPECHEKYKKERETPCIYCGLSATECICSSRDLKHSKSFAKSLHSYLFYDRDLTVFQNVLYRLKRDSDRASEIFFARELSAEIMKLAAVNRQHLSEWCITFPPRSEKARLDYGFDQSKGLAKRIARYTGMKYEDVIKRKRYANKAQKDLGGALRRANAEKIYFLAPKADVKGKKYIIVDDVITTGSTVLQCQKLLLKGGAKEVFPISIAKTYFRGLGFDSSRKRQKRPDTTWFM